MQIETERTLPRPVERVRGQRTVLGHGLTVGECGRHTPIVQHGRRALVAERGGGGGRREWRERRERHERRKWQE
ncbi:hypothetical protein Shyhy01_16030 [Streptomyces hygroscopicus subsp. hygroscopicus]|nr:hypothetical protein Shyhy01_16030 [Streptomyces hygroscopicus subsp. hygroscopicus]